jgi:hypothetical protein
MKSLVGKTKNKQASRLLAKGNMSTFQPLHVFHFRTSPFNPFTIPLEGEDSDVTLGRWGGTQLLKTITTTQNNYYPLINRRAYHAS